MPGQLSITPRVSDYIRASSLREDDVLRSLREETERLPGGQAMQVLPEEAQLLAMLIGLTGARHVVEIGTFTGYRTLCMARALPTDGTLVTSDPSPRWAAIAHPHWHRAAVHTRIDHHLTDPTDTLNTLLDTRGPATTDLIILNADKPGSVKHYETALSLLTPTGLLAITNTLFLGRVADPTATDPHTTTITDFNTMLHEDPRVDISMLPMGDGITLVRKNKATWSP